MLKVRYVFIGLGMLLHSAAYSAAQVSIGIGLPNVSIGINLPLYPELVVVPDYPVYYAPQLEANFFFYDGLYWVYQDDNWYASSWYNGPWWFVDAEVVPVYVLRVPVRYYRHPPPYFHGWRADAPPRWGDHWGRDWEQRRSGWDRGSRRAVPAPAPLPVYQRHYSGDRYPRQVEHQQDLQKRNYRYQPRDPVVQQHYQGRAVQRAPEKKGSMQPNIRRSTPPQQDGSAAPRAQSRQRGDRDAQRPTPGGSSQQTRPNAQDPGQSQSGATQHEQQIPKSQSVKQQGRDAARKPKRVQKKKQEQQQEQENKQERNRDRYE